MNRKGPVNACPEREPDLEAYIADTLTGPARAGMEAHLAECPACRAAAVEARSGLEALMVLSQAPTPFPQAGSAAEGQVRWTAFLQRLRRQGVRGVIQESAGAPRTSTVPPAMHRWSRAAAAAALILLGIGVGRWSLPPAENGGTAALTEQDAWIQSAQIESLARAEVLLELGVPWLDGLREVVTGMMRVAQTDANLQGLRERARRLIQDGRSLAGALDPGHDADLLATIRRAEVFLEEVAVIPDGGIPTFFTQTELIQLQARFAGADAEGAAERALTASGWIAVDSGIKAGERP